MELRDAENLPTFNDLRRQRAYIHPSILAERRCRETMEISKGRRDLYRLSPRDPTTDSLRGFRPQQIAYRHDLSGILKPW